MHFLSVVSFLCLTSHNPVVVLRFFPLRQALVFLFFFFFKQKPAYEMPISDWSSDVCSSDLSSVSNDADPVWNDMLFFDVGTDRSSEVKLELLSKGVVIAEGIIPHKIRELAHDKGPHHPLIPLFYNVTGHPTTIIRSAERRVGKECVQYV